MLSRKPASGLKFNDEERKKLEDKIADFYLNERGESIGVIHRQQIFELFTEQFAPMIYNKALDDVKKWYMQQQENMDSDFYLLYMDHEQV